MWSYMYIASLVFIGVSSTLDRDTNELGGPAASDIHAADCTNNSSTTYMELTHI
jgi:hypothetical protein